MTIKERFLKYVKIDTQSNPFTGEHPSTKKQFDLAKLLVEELNSLGASNVRIDEEHCYVYAEIPANIQNKPSIGFIAHIDTEPVCSGKDVNPQSIIYDGGDITLKNGTVIALKDFHELETFKGQEMITTDGTTLLGADDKAGVAEIMTMVETLLTHPEIKHGKIGVAFTPDEEIGEGPNFFDVKGFGCDFAYTVDGELLGEFGYETFNAAEAELQFKGINIHPGGAKGRMKNCVLMANDFLSMLPEDEIPAKTEGREGFYHVESVNAEVEKGKILLIIRDHDREKFEAKKQYVMSCAEKINEKYGENSVKCTVRDQYKNYLEVINKHYHLVENALRAMKEVGVTPFVNPVRGGTDGCTLSFMGLPCPNLFTGGLNAHSVKELIPVPAMEKALETILKIIEIYAE